MGGFTYILASKPYGTLYVGVTADLVRRGWEHQQGLSPGFTQKYDVHRLVWFEWHELIVDAIHREKRLKKWNRRWKIDLIEGANPGWEDLYPGICW